MANPLKSLLCSHRWEEQPEVKGVVMDTGILLNYKDVVCSKCGKKTRMTRQQFVQHLIETKRFAA